jgi:hypothetical protein
MDGMVHDQLFMYKKWIETYLCPIHSLLEPSILCTPTLWTL